MKNNLTFHRFFQILIMLSCLVILIFRFTPIHSDAQTTTCTPALDFTDPANPRSRAWPQGTNVSVILFEKSTGATTTQAEADAINTGLREWNNHAVTGCSNVTFSNLTRANRVWDGQERPPDNTVYIVRTTDRPGQWDPIIIASGVRSGWLYMNSNYDHIIIPQGQGPLYRVDNLVKHEAGHSFGIANGSSSYPPSVMSQNSFTGTEQILRITACDVEAHRRM